jgi:predicted metal-dependent hydrolase
MMDDVGGIPLIYKSHKRAKKMKLKFDALSGCGVVTVPTFCSKLEAFRFAGRHRDWLEAQKKSSPQKVLLMPGNVIPFLGDEKIIHHKKDNSSGVEITQEHIIVGGPIEGFPVRLENYLKKTAGKYIEPIAAQFAETAGVRYKKIQIRDTKSRWGSSSTTGTLSFSWRLIMTPPDILKYVVAHEIAHIREMNHSAAFWSQVDQLVENAKPARRWLRSEGQALMYICRH